MNLIWLTVTISFSYIALNTSFIWVDFTVCKAKASHNVRVIKKIKEIAVIHFSAGNWAINHILHLKLIEWKRQLTLPVSKTLWNILTWNRQCIWTDIKLVSTESFFYLESFLYCKPRLFMHGKSVSTEKCYVESLNTIVKSVIVSSNCST